MNHELLDVKPRDEKRPTPVASLFLEKDDKFLLVFDPKFKRWRVPGGRTEFEETLEETLSREMKEELNLNINTPKFLGFGQDIQYLHTLDKMTSRVILYFYVKTDKEVKVDQREAQEYKWLTWDELKNHENLEEAMLDFFKRNPNINF